MPIRKLTKPKIMVVKAGSPIMKLEYCHNFTEARDQCIIVYLKIKEYYIGMLTGSGGFSVKIKKKDCRELTECEIAKFNEGPLKRSDIRLDEVGQIIPSCPQ